MDRGQLPQHPGAPGVVLYTSFSLKTQGTGSRTKGSRPGERPLVAEVPPELKLDLFFRGAAFMFDVDLGCGRN